MRDDRIFGRKLLGLLLRERRDHDAHERMVGRLLTASLEREREQLMTQALRVIADAMPDMPAPPAALPDGVVDEVPVCPDCGCAEGEQATWEGGDGVWFQRYVCTCDCHYPSYGGSAA